MNIEFILLVFDYFKVLKRRDFVSEWVLPLIISALVFVSNRGACDLLESFRNSSGTITNLLGVLIGFSIAVITLLLTASSKNIEEIKTYTTQYKISGKQLTLYDLLLIHYSYSVVIEILLTIFNLIIPGLLKEYSPRLIVNLLNSFNIFLVSHILLLTIRNITGFYFTLMKK